MSRKKDLIRYTLRNEQQLENCIRAIADEFIKRQGDPKAKPLQIIGNPSPPHRRLRNGSEIGKGDGLASPPHRRLRKMFPSL